MEVRNGKFEIIKGCKQTQACDNQMNQVLITFHYRLTTHHMKQYSHIKREKKQVLTM